MGTALNHVRKERNRAGQINSASASSGGSLSPSLSVCLSPPLNSAAPPLVSPLRQFWWLPVDPLCLSVQSTSCTRRCLTTCLCPTLGSQALPTTPGRGGRRPVFTKRHNFHRQRVSPAVRAAASPPAAAPPWGPKRSPPHRRVSPTPPLKYYALPTIAVPVHRHQRRL